MASRLDRALWRPRKLYTLFKARAAARSGQVDHYRIFQGVGDALWFDLNTAGYRKYPELQAVLPSLPNPNDQKKFIGSSGDTALAEAFRAYLAWRDLAAECGHPITADSRVLDFGCGWGRTLRFFLRDVPADRLTGIDVLPEAIGLSQQTNRWCNFRLTPALPPTDLPSGTFDLIYLYSVFSHLSEEAVDAWVTEFARLMKPGGILIATTWYRHYMEICAQSRLGPTPGTHPGSVRAFTGDIQEWLAKYDRGEICHSPVGGGTALDASFYGETCIPAAYARQKWADRFAFRRFIEADQQRFWQNVIVMQKPQ